MEDTCRGDGTPRLPELGHTALLLPAPPDTPPGRGVIDLDPVAPGDDVAVPLKDDRVLGAQMKSAGDRYGNYEIPCGSWFNHLGPGGWWQALALSRGAANS